MLIIGYKYKSALGVEIKKAVICEDVTEYKKMKDKIEEAGLEPIEFDYVYKASVVVH